MSTQVVSRTNGVPQRYPFSPRPRRREQHLGALSRLRADAQREIRLHLHGLLETLPTEVGEVYDEQEQCDREQGHELDFKLLAMRSQALRVAELALERCRRGLGSQCVECGRAIDEARLRALPSALRCRPCQEAVELRAHSATTETTPAVPWR